MCSPGMASSKSLTLRRRGETYCSSIVFMAFSCLDNRLKICDLRMSVMLRAGGSSSDTHIVIDVPGLVKLRHLGILAVPLAMLARCVQVMTEALNEGGLAQRLRPLRDRRLSVTYIRTKANAIPPTLTTISCSGSNTLNMPSGLCSPK